MDSAMKSTSFLPNTNRSIKSEIGSFRSVRVNVPSISDLMESPLLFFSFWSQCLCGEFSVWQLTTHGFCGGAIKIGVK